MGPWRPCALSCRWPGLRWSVSSSMALGGPGTEQSSTARWRRRWALEPAFSRRMADGRVVSRRDMIAVIVAATRRISWRARPPDQAAALRIVALVGAVPQTLAAHWTGAKGCPHSGRRWGCPRSSALRRAAGAPLGPPVGRPAGRAETGVLLRHGELFALRRALERTVQASAAAGVQAAVATLERGATHKSPSRACCLGCRPRRFAGGGLGGHRRGFGGPDSATRGAVGCRGALLDGPNGELWGRLLARAVVPGSPAYQGGFGTVDWALNRVADEVARGCCSVVCAGRRRLRRGLAVFRLRPLRVWCGEGRSVGGQTRERSRGGAPQASGWCLCHRRARRVSRCGASSRGLVGAMGWRLAPAVARQPPGARRHGAWWLRCALSPWTLRPAGTSLRACVAGGALPAGPGGGSVARSHSRFRGGVRVAEADQAYRPRCRSCWGSGAGPVGPRRRRRGPALVSWRGGYMASFGARAVCALRANHGICRRARAPTLRTRPWGLLSVLLSRAHSAVVAAAPPLVRRGV